MEDEKIVAMYWDRNEQAIAESRKKYGSYCHNVAHNILFDPEDEEECINDTWLRAWNTIPPQKPAFVSVFLGKITRNLAFDVYKKKHREKRGQGKLPLILDELSECVSGKDDPEGEVLADELKKTINEFLTTLPEENRYMFVLRYWYSESIRDIAKRFNKSENSITVTLSRIRGKLKEYLATMGYLV